MGCNASKTAQEVSYDPLRVTGIGSVARGWDEWLKSQTSPQQVSVLTGSWEISRDKLVSDHHVMMGEAAFGIVYEGKVFLNDMKEATLVTIKTLRADDKATTVDFVKEIQFMKEISHGNIVRMLGAITNDLPMKAIFEHASFGALKTFLEQARAANALSTTQMLQMTMDVAQGVGYLAGKGIIHRDLVSFQLCFYV